MYVWEAVGRYEDGTEIRKEFPYRANGNYAREEEEQHNLECWLIEQVENHGDCTFYSVNFIEKEDES